jgi:hypothetical protein
VHVARETWGRRDGRSWREGAAGAASGGVWVKSSDGGS